MKRYLVAGVLFRVRFTGPGRIVLCGLRSREQEMHDDAQPACRTHEEHGWSL
jgi:hypothetical protein